MCVHVRCRYVEDRLSGCLRRPIEVPAELRERGFGQRRIQDHLAAQEAVWGDDAQKHVRVGDGGQAAASTVARRSRIRSGAPGPDFHDRRGVEPRDRSSPRADGRHVDGRQDHGEIANLILRGVRWVPVQDEGHVRAGAAHVECHEPGDARQPGHVGCADDARGRSGEQGLHRFFGRTQRRHDAAV